MTAVEVVEIGTLGGASEIIEVANVGGPSGPAGPPGPVGGALDPTPVKIANYPAVANDFVPVDTTNGNVTITLPTAPPNNTTIGVRHITQVGTNTVTVAVGGGSDKFNKPGAVAPTFVITLLSQTAVFTYDSSVAVWYPVSSSFNLGTLDTRFAASNRGMPTGGTGTQVLSKNSATDYDASWQTVSGGGGGAPTGAAGGSLAGTYPNPTLNATSVADLNTFTSVAKGLAPASGGGTTNYLRTDGAWANPVAGPTFSTYLEKHAGMFVPKRALDRWQQAMKPWITTLSAAITNVATSITVTSIEGIPPLTRFRIYVENEQMLVTAGSGTTTWTVVRGINSTTAAAHAINVPVYGEAIMRVVSIGDSTAESSIGGGGISGSGGDGWVARLARILSRISGLPLLSPQLGGGGFFGVWRNSDPNIGGGAGNSGTEWTCPGGAWTLVPAGVANDRAPWGWNVTANSATNILKFTPPAYLGNILCIDVYFNDAATSGCSYDINNSGTWVSIGGTAVLPNTMHRVRVTSGAAITDFRLRAAAAGGAALTPRITGVDVWNAAPVFGVTQGLKMTNLGKDSDFLSQFNRTNASGDNFALFDGDPGSLQPDLAILGPFTNDILLGSGAYAGYGNHLTTVVNRFKPYCDVILVGYSEQGGARAPSDQQTLRNHVHTVAQNLGVAYLDMYDAMVGQGITGWAAADAEGYHGTIHDVNHYGPLGHQEMAARFDRMLTSF